MVEVEQNLAICIILSAVGGILEVFATAALAYPDAKQKEGKWRHRPWLSKTCLLANVALQIAASVVGNLLAPWYGPVSIVGPTFLSAQLVANMVIYGSVLGLENFTKDMRIGTCVIVTAAILLPVVGPGVQVNQQVDELLTRWYSYAWNAFLVLGMLISGLVLTLRSCTRTLCQLHSVPTRYAILLTARATSFAVNLSFSKVFALNPEFTWLIASIVLKVLSGMIMTGSIVVQSTAVSQNTFVPLNATTLILINALTGIIVWEDWRVVASWLGYVTVFVQLIVGNYLLLGEIDLFGPQNQRYGRRLLLRRITGQFDVNNNSGATCQDGSIGGENNHGHESASSPNETIPQNTDLETGQLKASHYKQEELASPTATIATVDSSSDPMPSVRSHVSGDVAAAWMSASADDSGGELSVFMDEGIDVQTTSRPAPIMSIPAIHRNETMGDDSSLTPTGRPPHLARPNQINNNISTLGDVPPPPMQKPTTLHTTTNHSRPSTLHKRSLTTGGATSSLLPTNMATTTPTSTTRPTSVQPSGRSQSMGIAGEPLEAVSQRRAQFFGASPAAVARRNAWGQIFGVDPLWLERRSSVRRMEPILEMRQREDDDNILFEEACP